MEYLERGNPHIVYQPSLIWSRDLSHYRRIILRSLTSFIPSPTENWRCKVGQWHICSLTSLVSSRTQLNQRRVILCPFEKHGRRPERGPRGLTFTWWGCYGLCLTKPTRACPLLFILFLCLFLSLWPFQLYFIPYILQTTLRFLTLFLWSKFCLIGPFNYISLYESLL